MFLSREIDIKLRQNYTKSLYSPYYVTKTSANGSSVYWACDTLDNDTAMLLAEVIVTSYSTVYIRFGIILTQFYINFSRQEHQIDVL